MRISLYPARKRFTDIASAPKLNKLKLCRRFLHQINCLLAEQEGDEALFAADRQNEYGLDHGGTLIPALIGRSGLIAADQKREGDGATPRGHWPLREVFFRPDRIGALKQHCRLLP